MKKPVAKKLQSSFSSKKPSFLNKKDKRYAGQLKQLKERGFSDTETWGLYSVIAGFILPRLIRFKQIRVGWPMGKNEKEWDDILGKMIFAFQWVDNNDYHKLSNEEQREGHIKCEEGLGLFAKYLLDLWW